MHCTGWLISWTIRIIYPALVIASLLGVGCQGGFFSHAFYTVPMVKFLSDRGFFCYIRWIFQHIGLFEVLSRALSRSWGFLIFLSNSVIIGFCTVSFEADFGCSNFQSVCSGSLAVQYDITIFLRFCCASALLVGFTPDPLPSTCN